MKHRTAILTTCFGILVLGLALVQKYPEQEEPAEPNETKIEILWDRDQKTKDITVINTLEDEVLWFNPREGTISEKESSIKICWENDQPQISINSFGYICFGGLGDEDFLKSKPKEKGKHYRTLQEALSKESGKLIPEMVFILKTPKGNWTIKCIAITENYSATFRWRKILGD